MKSEGNAGPAVAARGTVDLPTEPAARPAHWPKRPDRTAWTSPIRRVPDDEQAAAAARAATAAAERAAAKAAADEDARQLAALRKASQPRRQAPVERARAARPTPGPRKPRAARQAPRAAAPAPTAPQRRPGVLDAGEVEQLVEAGLARMTPTVPLEQQPAEGPVKPPARGKGIDRAEVVRLYLEEHLSTLQIAERLGISSATVYYHLRRAETPMRPVPPPPPAKRKVDVDEAARLYADGWTMVQLGRRYGVTHAAISQRFKAAGITITPRTSPAQQAHEAALARREQLLPEIRRLFDEGLTHAAMAAALDVSEPYLKRILADLGLRRRQRLDGDEIVRLYLEERLGIERIARQLRTAQQAIRYHLLKRGVQIRGRHETKRHETKRLADERPDLHARALEMLRAGEPAMTVAAVLHVGASTVGRWRDAAGIAARASGHRRDAQAADDGEPSPAAARRALLDALLVERFGPRPPRPQSRRPPVARVAADPLPETARRRRVLAEADERRTAEEATA